MNAWLDDGDVRLYHGDALEQLAALPAESVQCIVTSPPFWALRDYGVDGQIGLEATPDEWCQRLVAVFRECRRVLRNDGVMWLECGDTYANAPASGTAGQWNGSSPLGTRNVPIEGVKPHKRPEGYKPKDLVGAPWMLAFALRADGWYLRSDTIWARPNPMPESVTDRPTKAHSYVFLLTKQARYFYDADAIREDATGHGGMHPFGASGNGTRQDGRRAVHRDEFSGRNARSVWSIATEPTPFAHFATFPQALVERCIKAGTSEYGACSSCGAPWERQTERTSMVLKRSERTHSMGQTRSSGTMLEPPTSKTTGWAAACDCNAATRPCVVLDPFMGSGTTALVSRRLGRNAVGIELNADYLKIAAARLQQLSLLGGAS